MTRNVPAGFAKVRLNSISIAWTTVGTGSNSQRGQPPITIVHPQGLRQLSVERKMLAG